MKYFLAVCVWLALCVGAMVFTRTAGLAEALNIYPAIKLMLIEWGILFFVCVGGAFLSGSGRETPLPAVRRGSNTMIDPSKWSYDAASGEYFRILYDHPEGQLLDHTPYIKRKTHYLTLLRQNQSNKTLSKIFIPITIVLGIITFFSFSADVRAQYLFINLVILFVFMLCLAVAIGSVAGVLSSKFALANATDYLGPTPVTPHSPRDAIGGDSNQARQPTPQEMARAISARANRGREPEFPA